MHEAGLAGKRPKEKYHSYKGEVGKIADNVIDRNFSTTAPLQKWTTDVSQFNFSWGKCYLYVIDKQGNLILGKRNGNGRDGKPTPHPTLIGGANPEVQMAGLVRISGGKIVSYDDRSGHFKPNPKSMSVAHEAFGKLPQTLFKRKGGS